MVVLVGCRCFAGLIAKGGKDGRVIERGGIAEKEWEMTEDLQCDHSLEEGIALQKKRDHCRSKAIFTTPPQKFIIVVMSVEILQS